jgi:hypothetical protein
MTTPTRLTAACLLAALACATPESALHPFDPPPNIAPGQPLFTVPDDLVAELAEATTLALREATLQAAAEGRRIFSGANVEAAIRAHRIETGMTVDEVVLAVGSQPTKIRDQGPPGGHTLLWEPPGSATHRRFWVRFDQDGHAMGAGTH